MTKRKGQMEMIGLVIIVIIVTMAMLFYLSYNANKKTSKSIYNEFVETELDNGFISAFLSTTACGDIQMRYLITDCGTRNRVVCTGQSKTSCQQLEDVLVTIKNETLDLWNVPYWLSINMSTQEIYYNTSQCSRDTVGQSAPAFTIIPFHPDPRQAIIELGICG